MDRPARSLPPSPDDLLSNLPFPATAIFQPVPANLRRAMHTVHPVGRYPLTKRPAGWELVLSSVDVMNEIIAASKQRLSRDDSRTALVFTQTRNVVTGASGVIVQRQFGGQLMRPLAEVLGATGKLDESARRHASALGWAAANGKLHLVAFRPFEDRPWPSVFAALNRSGAAGDRDYDFLARLFVTQFEFGQWTDLPPLEEKPEDSVS